MSRRAVCAWTPPGVVAAVILVAAVIPGTALATVAGAASPRRTLLEAATHLAAFFVLALATWRSGVSQGWSRGASVGLTLGWVAALAVGSELSQLAVPSRMCDVVDVALDGLGGIVGLVIAAGADARGS